MTGSSGGPLWGRLWPQLAVALVILFVSSNVGAVVEVTCKAGTKEVKAYGETKINGKYSITVKGFNYKKHGGNACKAKLHAAPKGSSCNIPTGLHWGNKGASLKVKSKTKYEVVLSAKPFAYAPKTPYKECFSFSNVIKEGRFKSEKSRYEASFPNPFNKCLNFATKILKNFTILSNFNVAILHTIILGPAAKGSLRIRMKK
ncbi:hypothetical protein D5086_026798 [Populus alba]|uniref:Uncharacterized protein n=1 Tax=Populus alba TaxID=43335 RepID=A0ACC4B2V8_POPAL